MVALPSHYICGPSFYIPSSTNNLLLFLFCLHRIHTRTVLILFKKKLEESGLIYSLQSFVMSGRNAKEVFTVSLMFWLLSWYVKWFDDVFAQWNFLLVAIEASSPRKEPKSILLPPQKYCSDSKNENCS